MARSLSPEEEELIEDLKRRLEELDGIETRVRAAKKSVLSWEYKMLLTYAANTDANPSIHYYAGLIEGLAISGRISTAKNKE